jgi:hypothetical protein
LRGRIGRVRRLTRIKPRAAATRTLPARTDQPSPQEGELFMKTLVLVDNKKDGPAYKEVAAKLKGKPDAEQKLYTHLTTHPKVKVDGKEETHESLKTTDDAQIKNVIQWILSR